MPREKSINEIMTISSHHLMDAKKIGENYIIGVYQGGLSDFDILIKYKEKQGNEWSRIRTPKHIHWAVDMLIKRYNNSDNTQKLILFLIDKWDGLVGIKNVQEQESVLNNVMTISIPDELIQLNYGIYSIEFLFRLALLLMIQEKTNREDAYIFKDLLEALLEQKDLFRIISIATRRKP